MEACRNPRVPRMGTQISVTPVSLPDPWHAALQSPTGKGGKDVCDQHAGARPVRQGVWR